MNPDELESLIKQGLERFYEKRIANLSELRLLDVLKRKNPYLLKALGVENIFQFIEELLKQHLSASDETIFGEVFVEPIALAVSGGKKSSASGVDLEIETETTYKAIAVKSGSNVFNSSQVRQMNSQFEELRRRLDQYLRRVGKHFDPILGAAYGKKRTEATSKRSYRILAGQAFWEELTGDPDFYLKIVRLMRDYPVEHRRTFERELNKAINRFIRDFSASFLDQDGNIDWEKLVQFNSGQSAS